MRRRYRGRHRRLPAPTLSALDAMASRMSQLGPSQLITNP